MPDAIVIISGTSTGVGKTWLATQLIRGLRARGIHIAARKPVESFEPLATVTDAELLAEASGEDPRIVCPAHRRYGLAMAPPIAAARLGRSRYTIPELVDEMALPPEGVAIIEGVGGARSPLAFDGDTVDLAHFIGANLVVIAADPGLGAINDVRLTTAAFGARSKVVYLNRFDRADEVQASNLAYLRDVIGLEVLTNIEDWYQDRSRGPLAPPAQMEAR